MPPRASAERLKLNGNVFANRTDWKGVEGMENGGKTM